ncbi:saccharopine dehydrogenase (NADP+, L-glutamate forming) [Algoriphagus hitonicola]|uniref:Saccharopine dehydrogenase (NADP+, L-glutamate forming) n=1 Tax=Algoriphagus hitonicola TaxID=435880 RepID=A0A1I2W6R0_9BACT|nr:saccharopine dehydrogenase C-terminal domain-containing protein [Algoriphagus hitonicola]SFG96317.1 saccharopine dehydrogenase (NADP+, L-glutamate forming) [Algoriphagus hitonicola]
MHRILIIGAGKSSTYLIDFLADSCSSKDRTLTLADLDPDLAKKRLKTRKNTFAKKLDIEDAENRRMLIQESDVVISMLPAMMHPMIAKDCLDLGRHFFSASYESKELRAMRSEIEQKGLLFLNECGLDPGIDHMSAMKIINEVKANGEEIISFKSFTGGLLAPESEDNPWKYKFTWNPRNVVLAGKGLSRYVEQSQLKYVPYHQLFRRIEKIQVDGIGNFDGYPNRDSLEYREIYGLLDIPTLLRGTLRREGFCKAWDVFVQLGMTDESLSLTRPAESSLREFLNSFLPFDPNRSVEEKLTSLIPEMDYETFEKIQWLGFFSDRKLPRTTGTPAEILQDILEIDWALDEDDRDMIVMQHLFEIKSQSGIRKLTSSLVCKGENSTYTAMAKTVGLPLAMAVDLFLDGKITAKGLRLPILAEIYDPILLRLEKEGIVFTEKTEEPPLRL